MARRRRTAILAVKLPSAILPVEVFRPQMFLVPSPQVQGLCYLFGKASAHI